MLKLYWKDLDVPDGSIHYGFYHVFPPLTELHVHDFHELFLVVDGVIVHRFGREEQLLEAGSVVFIRDRDAHGFRREAGQECFLLNTAFPPRLYGQLLQAVGLGDRAEALFEPVEPPRITLGQEEAARLANRLMLAREVGPECLQPHLRAVLQDWLARLLCPTALPDESLPSWLTELCTAMRRKENFLIGRERLRALSGRTPEHLARSFQRYLGMTPTQFVNRARLDYACDLLQTTNLPVTEVCLEAGFQNLSHFCRLFEKHHTCSPTEFRRRNVRARVI